MSMEIKGEKIKRRTEDFSFSSTPIFDFIHIDWAMFRLHCHFLSVSVLHSLTIYLGNYVSS